MKNDLRFSIRRLVSPLEADDPEKAKWKQVAGGEANQYAKEEWETAERLRPTKSMTISQDKSVMQQETKFRRQEDCTGGNRDTHHEVRVGQNESKWEALEKEHKGTLENSNQLKLKTNANEVNEVMRVTHDLE